VHHEALRDWIRQAEAEAEADVGERDDLLTTEEDNELAQLRREVRDLRRANCGFSRAKHRGFHRYGALRVTSRTGRDQRGERAAAGSERPPLPPIVTYLGGYRVLYLVVAVIAGGGGGAGGVDSEGWTGRAQ
jgi:transposase-like protein